MKLSILILTLKSRKRHLSNLIRILSKQLDPSVEILTETDNGEKRIGEKRNILLNRAKGEYIAFIDDDDEVSEDYVKKVLKAIESKPDCCSLTGLITTNNESPAVFRHSLEYDAWRDNCDGTIKYERPPNHLNAIKREIAIKYSFIPVNHGEDREWSDRIKHELKTESNIDGVIYHYKFISNK